MPGQGIPNVKNCSGLTLTTLLSVSNLTFCLLQTFSIHYGKLLVTIHNTTSLLETGDVFFVPFGKPVFYSQCSNNLIRSLQRTSLLTCKQMGRSKFCQGKKFNCLPLQKLLLPSMKFCLFLEDSALLFELFKLLQ